MHEQADLFKISNCVINLSPDKVQVFRDACRDLRPGGAWRLRTWWPRGEFPESVKADPRAHCGCITGAMGGGALTILLQEVGFTGVSVEESRDVSKKWFPGNGLETCVCSAQLRARKPHG